MARQFGPDEAYRLVYRPGSGATAAGLTGKLYADLAGTTAADVLYEDGSSIPTSGGMPQVTINAYSQWPRLQYPASGADTIYGSVNGGPIVPLLSDLDARVDANTASLASLNVNAVSKTLVTAKGDIVGASASSTPARIAVGSDRQALIADSTQSTGVAWASPVASVSRSARPQVSSWITTFQSGHGFSIFGGLAASAVDDTADFTIGTQSYAVTCQSNGNLSAVQKTGIAGIDTTGKSLVLALKVDDATNINAMLVYFGTDNFSSYYVWSGIMNAGLNDQRFFKSGEYAFLTLSFADAAQVGSPTRNGVTALRLRFSCTNGNATTVRWQGVGLSPEQSTYPNGVVSISFDDSYDSQYLVARPRLDLYGFAGTAYTIQDLVGGAGSMTLAQLHALEDVNGWDVAAHSWTTADHAVTFVGLSAAQLDSNLLQSRSWLDRNGFRGARHLAYPGGRYQPNVIAAARPYFSSARTVLSTMQCETVPPADPFRLRSWSVLNTDATAALAAAVDAAYTNKGWLHLTFHKIVASAAASIEYDTAKFNTVIDYIATKGIAVRTVREVLGGA